MNISVQMLHDFADMHSLCTCMSMYVHEFFLFVFFLEEM